MLIDSFLLFFVSPAMVQITPTVLLLAVAAVVRAQVTSSFFLPGISKQALAGSVYASAIGGDTTVLISNGPGGTGLGGGTSAP